MAASLPAQERHDLRLRIKEAADRGFRFAVEEVNRLLRPRGIRFDSAIYGDLHECVFSMMPANQDRTNAYTEGFAMGVAAANRLLRFTPIYFAFMPSGALVRHVDYGRVRTQIRWLDDLTARELERGRAIELESGEEIVSEKQLEDVTQPKEIGDGDTESQQ